ncbi:MAG: hypothetical protein O3A80_01950 [bacterium]|nr:hypothetical protein [bacterium]
MPTFLETINHLQSPGFEQLVDHLHEAQEAESQDRMTIGEIRERVAASMFNGVTFRLQVLDDTQVTKVEVFGEDEYVEPFVKGSSVALHAGELMQEATT